MMVSAEFGGIIEQFRWIHRMSGPMNSLLPWLPLFGPALAALVAIIGLGVTHALSSRRDLNSEKRKIRINFMIEAYRKLEAGSSRGKNQESIQISSTPRSRTFSF